MVNGPADVKTMDLLKKRGFRFKKKWGQNFLLDKNLLKKIVHTARITPGDRVVDIGAGAGTLTRELVEAGARVLAVEIDADLIPILRETLEGTDVRIVQGDILKMDLDELTGRHGLAWPYKVVANLPYYITTPILMNLLENEYHLELLVIMVQWEVAERLIAEPGTKAYGAVTLAVQHYCEIEGVFKVPRRLFTPPPDVDSAVIRLKRRAGRPFDVRDERLMFRIIRAAFGQRRKTISNALLKVSPEIDREGLHAILDRCGIDPRRRGETLSLREFAALANCWQEELVLRAK